MAKQAIWVMLKAKPGKEAEVEAFLRQGADLANDEPETVTWYGVKMAPGLYGVFDTFDNEAGRDARLSWRTRPLFSRTRSRSSRWRFWRASSSAHVAQPM